MEFEITPELDAKLKAAESLDEVVATLNTAGVPVTKEILEKELSKEQNAELSEDDLEDVSGGGIIAAFNRLKLYYALWYKLTHR